MLTFAQYRTCPSLPTLSACLNHTSPVNVSLEPYFVSFFFTYKSSIKSSLSLHAIIVSVFPITLLSLSHAVKIQTEESSVLDTVFIFVY